MASSGHEALVAFIYAGQAYWQRVDFEGHAIDPRAHKIDHRFSSPDAPRVTWTGSLYLIFIRDGLNLLMVRVTREGESSLKSWGAHPPVNRVESSMGETALTFVAEQPTLTVFDAEGDFLRQSPGIHGSDLFRTEGGWRIVRELREGNYVLGYAVFDPESGSPVISYLFGPVKGVLVVASPSGGAMLVPRQTGPGVVVDRFDRVHNVPLGSQNRDFAMLSAHSNGWTLFSTTGPEAAQVNVSLEGEVIESRPVELPPDVRQGHPAKLVSASHSRHLIIRGSSLGLEVFRVTDRSVKIQSNLGAADASQRSASVASGPGMDLVVWLEASFIGWEARATRVRDGVPLDGVGLYLGTAQPGTRAEVVFDGEMFIVVWRDHYHRLQMRRIGVDGALPGETVTIAQSGSSFDLTPRGDGAALVTWQEGSFKVAGSIIVDGVPGPTIFPMFPEEWGLNRVVHAFDGSHFLLVGAQDYPACQFLWCIRPPRTHTWVRRLNRDGTFAGPPIAVDEVKESAISKPLDFEEGWLVPLPSRSAMRLVRLTEGGIPYMEGYTMEGELLRTAAGPMVWAEKHRGMIDEDLRNDWFEPLPIEDGEVNEAPLAEGSFLLVRSSDRYSIREVTPHEKRADLAVSVVRTRKTATRIETVRIQHRGGDVIPSIRIGISGGQYQTSAGFFLPDLTSDRPVVDGVIAGPFAPGDSVEITLRWGLKASDDLFFWALPEARDENAVDNFLLLEAVEPRRRAVRRGE